MGDWTLLIIGGSAHLVDLSSKVTEIKDFGSFPTEIQTRTPSTQGESKDFTTNIQLSKKTVDLLKLQKK